MDTHLGLDLKALGEHRKALGEEIAEGPVAGHDIADIGLEEMIDGATNQAIAEVVEGTLILLEIGRGQAVADYHIRIALQYHIRHLPPVLRRVGVVSVYHDITLGVNLPEHPADDIALALLVFVADHGAGCAGKLCGVILRVVVIDIDDGLGELTLPVCDHLFDGFAFVVAGD